MVLVKVKDAQDALECGHWARKDEVKSELPQYLRLHVDEVTFCDLILLVFSQK